MERIFWKIPRQPRILVHPMSAESSEQSIAFELQAIGRVRRWGQPRNEAGPKNHGWIDVNF
jgi:hypothetical protein